MKVFGKSKTVFNRKTIRTVFVNKSSFKGCKLTRDAEIIRDGILDLVSPTFKNVC